MTYDKTSKERDCLYHMRLPAHSWMERQQSASGRTYQPPILL